MTIRSIRILFLFLALLTSATFAAAAPLQEIEAPCAEPGIGWICYGEYASCSLTTGDLDDYRFWGESGDEIIVCVAGTSNCPDPRVDVLRPDNTILAEGECITSCSTGPCAFSIITTLDADGMHRIRVDEVGNTESGGYVLHLEKILPDEPIQQLNYGVSTSVTINHRGDIDFLQFEGLAGADVRISVAGQSNCLDPVVEVLDPTLRPLDAQSCTTSCSTGPCAFNLDLLTLPMTGTYTLMFSDVGRTETGTMSVVAHCLSSPDPSGECPSSLPTVPLGTSYCTSNPNSSGAAATISATGVDVLTENHLFLRADGVPAGELGIFFAGLAANPSEPDLPFPSEGQLCISAPIFRFPVVPTCNANTMEYRPDLTTIPAAPGQTWYFQAWFRDGSVSNSTDGLAIAFQ